MTEIWREIKGYNGDYMVSNAGRFKSLKNGKERILVQKPATGGYLYVYLCKNGFVTAHRTHRLVAKTFIENPSNLPQVNHINEVKTDNNVNNLEWVTPAQNRAHGTRNARISKIKKKPIVQLDKNTLAVIKEYPSGKDAAQETGIAVSDIYGCCGGVRMTAGGYAWARI